MNLLDSRLAALLVFAILASFALIKAVETFAPKHALTFEPVFENATFTDETFITTAEEHIFPDPCGLEAVSCEGER